MALADAVTATEHVCGDCGTRWFQPDDGTSCPTCTALPPQTVHGIGPWAASAANRAPRTGAHKEARRAVAGARAVTHEEESREHDGH